MQGLTTPRPPRLSTWVQIIVVLTSVCPSNSCMALAVEPDEAFNPVDVRVLGPDAVVFKANLVSDAG
jgi:hypothetical protein